MPGVHVEDLGGGGGGGVDEALLRHLAGVHAVLPDHRHPGEDDEVAFSTVISSVREAFSPNDPYRVQTQLDAEGMTQKGYLSVQRSVKVDAPGCVNATGKLGQKG